MGLGTGAREMGIRVDGFESRWGRNGWDSTRRLNPSEVGEEVLAELRRSNMLPDEFRDPEEAFATETAAGCPVLHWRTRTNWDDLTGENRKFQPLFCEFVDLVESVAQEVCQGAGYDGKVFFRLMEGEYREDSALQKDFDFKVRKTGGRRIQENRTMRRLTESTSTCRAYWDWATDNLTPSMMREIGIVGMEKPRDSGDGPILSITLENPFPDGDSDLHGNPRDRDYREIVQGAVDDVVRRIVNELMDGPRDRALSTYFADQGRSGDDWTVHLSILVDGQGHDFLYEVSSTGSGRPPRVKLLEASI